MAWLDAESGKRVYYEDYAGTERPVVLVHGWGMSARAWDYNLPALRQAGHRVVALDHRACGHSDKDFEDVSIAAIAGDVASLVRECGLDSPVIVGWSLGAAVSVEAALQLGDSVGGLALIGSPSPRYLQAEGWEIGGTPEAMAETAVALRTNRAGFLHDLTVGVFKNDPGPAVIEWMWSIFMETSPNADVSLIALGDLDHREHLPTLSLPVLLCHAPEDVVVAYDTSAKAVEMFPNAKLVDFTESGHAPFIEEQEKFESELLGFIAGI
jgi:pimeloyl-[acyl-carrier protein] methyl ester esterase